MGRAAPWLRAQASRRWGAGDALRLSRRDRHARSAAAASWRRRSPAVPGSPYAQTVARLRCLRGVDTLSAVGLAAEFGDFARFDQPGKLMQLHRARAVRVSSGETRRQGKITKTGSKHARRLLVEAAWHYRKTPSRGVTLQRRQDGQPAQVIAISWQRNADCITSGAASLRSAASAARSSRSPSLASSPASAGRSPAPTDPGTPSHATSVEERRDLAHAREHHRSKCEQAARGPRSVFRQLGSHDENRSCGS